MPSQPSRQCLLLSPFEKLHCTVLVFSSAVGHNTLKNFVANVCKDVGIQGYKTNHSLQATAATRLYASGVDEQLVMERTGHPSIEGIRSYKMTSTEQQQNISDILSNSKRSCNHTAEVVHHQAAIVPQLPTHLTSTTNSLHTHPHRCR